MRQLRPFLAFVMAFGASSVSACGTADSVSETDNQGQCKDFVEDGGDAIPEPPDGASLCPTGNSCNYQSQEGCGAGMACYPAVTTGATTILSTCQPAGTGVSGDACNQWADCARGYGCVEARCRKLCCGADWSDAVCDAGESCYRELLFTVDEGDPDDDTDDVTASTGAYVCYPNGCDVFTSDECTSALDCKIIDPKGTTACVRPSPEALGEPCSGSSVCGRGLSCVGDPGEQTCRRLCRAELCGEPGCGPEETCVHFNRDPEGVGECTPGWSP